MKQRTVKRVIDMALGGVLFLLSIPLILIAAFLVWKRSPGPIIFRQEREGLGGRPFTLYKIRTMCLEPGALLERHLFLDPYAGEEWESYRRLKEDPRIIPGIGSFLRKSSLDELPQLWNILVGEMSLVGPRPLEIPVAERFPSESRSFRTSVRPGLTGLWQVSGRSETDLETLLEIDVEYLKGWSLWLDVTILLRTPGAVFSRRGAY